MSNPSWVPGVSGNPTGRSKGLAKGRRLFAMVIREQMPPEAAFHWLREVAAGRDPDRKPEDPGGSMPPDFNTRFKAMALILSYGYGTPAQLHVVEAEIRAFALNVDVDAMAGAGANAPNLNNDLLERLRRDLRAMVDAGDGLGKRALVGADED